MVRKGNLAVIRTVGIILTIVILSSGIFVFIIICYFLLLFLPCPALSYSYFVYCFDYDNVKGHGYPF